jgi:DNA-binding MarR family transcriptional regulator
MGSQADLPVFDPVRVFGSDFHRIQRIVMPSKGQTRTMDATWRALLDRSYHVLDYNGRSETEAVTTNEKSARKTESDLGTSVMAALRRIIRAIDLHSRKLVNRYGLTGPQLVVLKVLLDEAPLTVSELARAVNLSQATVTGILDRLEKKAMIQRERSTLDRRKVMVSPTATAERALSDAPPLLQEHFTDGFARLPDWQQTQILSSLQRIVALMEAGDVEAGPILTTGPLDATPEKTEEFLATSEDPQNGVTTTDL